MIFGIGDNDSGRVLPIGHYFSYRSRSIQLVMEMTRILGIHAETRFGLNTYPDFGLMTIRSKDSAVALRCDQILNTKKNRVLGGHEHNDQLSIQLVAGRESIIMDPGTYLYISQNEYRIGNMRTAVHSTVCVEGLEQNPVSNDWHYDERSAAAKIERAEGGTLSVTICYADVEHRRTVLVGKQMVEIVDMVKTERKCTVGFMMAPTLRLRSAGEYEAFFESKTLEVHVKTETPLWLEEAWYAEEYGAREKTLRLVASIQSSTRTLVTWREKRTT